METRIIGIEPHGKDYTLMCPKTKASVLLSSCIECEKHKHQRENSILLNKKTGEKIMTKIIKCTCKNEQQDQMYGDNMRVHNSKADPEKNGYRCTVCTKENR
jgi:hypothetical protein